MLRLVFGATCWKKISSVLLCGGAMLVAASCGQHAMASPSTECAPLSRNYAADMRTLSDAPPEELAELKRIMLAFAYPDSFVSESPDRRSAEMVRDGIRRAPLESTKMQQAQAAFRRLQRQSDC
jgi:hypothetical protein